MKTGRTDPGPMTAAPESAARIQSLIVIAILFALQVTDGIDQAVLSFTAPFVRKDLGIGFESLGAAFSAGYIGTALGAVLFGTLADYIGRKFALCLAAISFSIGSLCTIFVHTAPELVAIRLLTGLALGGLFPVVASLILETVATHLRATAATLVSVGTAAGVSLCGPLVAVIEPHFGWHAAFIIGGTIPAFLSILAIIFISNPRPSKARPDESTEIGSRTVRTPLDSVATLFKSDRWRITLVLWVAIIASGVAMFFSLSWLPSLAHSAGIKPGIAAIGPAIFSVAGMLVAILIARVVDKAGFRVLVLTTALGAPAFVLLGQSFGDGDAFLIVCGLAGAFSVSSVNLIGVIAGILYPHELRARGVGWAVAVMRLGGSLAPLLGGFLIARAVPVQMIFLGVAINPLISGLAIWVLWKMAKR
jgi:AAHS family 4-hydroxybenzoate transporter-like MFS transporter